MSQGDLQQRLDDVANSAVVRQSDFLRSTDKISQAKSTGRHDSNGLVWVLFSIFNCLSLYQSGVCDCALYTSSFVLTFNEFIKAVSSGHY